MDNLMKQMRGRFSGGKTEESSNTRTQRIPPQKSQSFKGDFAEKRTQNWFQKQFSGKMRNGNHDSYYNMEQVVAVAAAAYAVNLIAEPSIRDQQSLEPSLIKDKSRKEDPAFSILKPGTVSGQFTGESSMKGSESAERLTSTDQIGRSSSTKPRSSPKPDVISIQPERAASKPDLYAGKPEIAAPKPDHPTIKPRTAATRPEQLPTTTPEPPGTDYKRQTKADTWEKAEMAKIKERYAKLHSTILAWEEKKKKKAKNKLEKAESGLERKKARALTKFRSEMEYIKQVVEGARAEAQVRQRNDELKVKAKANKIRTTGELPRTCFCC